MGLTAVEAAAWSNDAAFLAWIEGTGAIVIATELKVRIADEKLLSVSCLCDCQTSLSLEREFLSILSKRSVFEHQK